MKPKQVTEIDAYVNRLDTGEREALLHTWRGWEDRIHFGERVELEKGRRIYKRLLQIVKENPQLSKPNEFLNWVLDNHIWTTAMCIRRLTETKSHRNRNISLRVILDDMMKNEGAIIREDFVKQGVIYPETEQRMHEQFDILAGNNQDFLSCDVMKAYLNILESANRKMSVLVDKYLAHHDEDRKPEPLTYGDVDMIIEDVFKVHNFIHFALTGSPGVSLPSMSDSWVRILKRPWIIDSEKA
jgi:hypothetical protein